MRLDQLARPFRIEQVGKALRRVLLFHQVRVVGERRDQNSRRRMESVRIVVALVEMLRDVLGQVRREPAVAFPDDAMSLIRRVDHIDGVDVAGVLLVDPGEDALGAGPLHADGDAGKLRLECLAEAFRKRQVHGGVEGELAFLLRRLDQRWANSIGRRGRGAQRRGIERKRRGGRPLEHVASGEFPLSHHLSSLI